uniref:Inositol polyphosphate-related phosphatase domain-containing protein n=1 Tax=Romanomermis culicivorax TaxID=13658 RepID=A0A915JBH9_ROMCU
MKLTRKYKMVTKKEEKMMKMIILKDKPKEDQLCCACATLYSDSSFMKMWKKYLYVALGEQNYDLVYSATFGVQNTCIFVAKHIRQSVSEERSFFKKDNSIMSSSRFFDDKNAKVLRNEKLVCSSGDFSLFRLGADNNKRLIDYTKSCRSFTADYVKSSCGSDPKVSAATDLFAIYDFIFWSGDMNSRLENVTADQAITQLLFGTLCISNLVPRDQIYKSLTNKGPLFENFKEPAINFLPSYKFAFSTSSYDFSRLPGYTRHKSLRYFEKTGTRTKIRHFPNLQFLIYTTLLFRRTGEKLLDHKNISTNTLGDGRIKRTLSRGRRFYNFDVRSKWRNCLNQSYKARTTTAACSATADGVSFKTRSGVVSQSSSNGFGSLAFWRPFTCLKLQKKNLILITKILNNKKSSFRSLLFDVSRKPKVQKYHFTRDLSLSTVGADDFCNGGETLGDCSPFFLLSPFIVGPSFLCGAGAVFFDVLKNFSGHPPKILDNH